MMDAQTLLPEYSHDQFDSRYRLVLVTAQRAKQLMQGAKPTGTSKFTKDATIALDEVLRGYVHHLQGQEARQAFKDSKRGRETDADHIAVVGGEDAQEIKKELSMYVDDTVKPVAPPETEE